MVTNRRLDPEALHRQLRRALRHGARASRLVRYTPDLVELLFPDEVCVETSVYDRAIYTETLLREAIEQIGGKHGQALSTILCFASGTLGATLEDRRRQAAELLDILPDTFRRERHEGLLLWDLAMVTYQLSKPPLQDPRAKRTL